MRLRMTVPILALMLSGAVLTGCASTRSLDYGDGSRGHLLYQAYHTWKAGDRNTALVYADKLIELHAAEARKMQASLSDYPPTDPPEATYEYGALNGVGVALWLKGEVLLEEGDKSGAIEAFSTLVDDFSYAQYRTPGADAWLEATDLDSWWRPAGDAKTRLAELRAETN